MKKLIAANVQRVILIAGLLILAGINSKWLERAINNENKVMTAASQSGESTVADADKVQGVPVDVESESSVQSTEVALWEIPEEAYDVISADHEAIGKWAELKITKESLVATTEEQFERFCHDRVEGSGYNWYTIACSDGTGIQFNGCFTGAATYGIIDKDGCIEDVLGYITLGDDGYEYSDAAE